MPCLNPPFPFYLHSTNPKHFVCKVWDRTGGRMLRPISQAWVGQQQLPACFLSPSQLSDWWLKTAYLEYRLPVVVHSSPGVVLPKQDFLDRQGQLR